MNNVAGSKSIRSHTTFIMAIEGRARGILKKTNKTKLSLSLTVKVMLSWPELACFGSVLWEEHRGL